MEIIPKVIRGQRRYDLFFTDHRLLAAPWYTRKQFGIITLPLAVEVVLLFTGGLGFGVPVLPLLSYFLFVPLVIFSFVLEILARETRDVHLRRYSSMTLDQLSGERPSNFQLPYDAIARATLEADPLHARLILEIAAPKGHKTIRLGWGHFRGDVRRNTGRLRVALQTALGPRFEARDFVSLP